MPQVLALAGRVEPDAGAELLAVRPHGDLARLAVFDALDRQLLVPVSPSDSRLSPGMNSSGSTPIIRRFERWIRS